MRAFGLHLLSALAMFGSVQWVPTVIKIQGAFAQEPSAANFAANIEVDRIEILGVTLFEQPTIESALEITVGDRLSRTKVLKTAQNLGNLYSVHGYEETKVSSELNRQKSEDGKLETVLRFNVTEGNPTRISDIQFIAENPKSDNFLRYWENVEKSLSAKVGLRRGDVFDQEKMAVDRRSIQDVLAAEEFIGAKVSEVQVKPGNPLPNESRPAARWVSLQIHVDLGDRVSFGFRGNQVLNKTALLAAVEEQRLLGFGSDYISAIKTRIEDEYKAIGYALVRTTVYTFEKPNFQERHVTYEIVEGPRVEIDSVEFEGNVVFSNEELTDRLFSNSSKQIQERYYVEKDIQKSADLLIEWLKSQGYLSAKLVTANRVFFKKNQKVRLSFYIYEGDQTLVQSIKLNGFKAVSETDARKILAIEEGKPLNLFAFNEGLEELKANYRSRGYLDALITNENTDNVVNYTQQNRYADLVVEVSEGIQYRVSRVEIEGLSGTKESVVRRELQLSPEDILEESRVSESERRLRRLGIFSLVTVRAVDDPQHPGYKVVRVSVQEGSPGIIAGGLGYRNDLGIRVFGQTGYSNVWHRNHTISFGTSINQRYNWDYCNKVNIPGIPNRRDPSLNKACPLEYQVQLGYNWPWFAFGETTFRPKLTMDRILYRLLDAATIAMTLTWERRIIPSTNLVGTLTYNLEQIHQSNSVVSDTIDNQTLTVGSVIGGMRLDLRDNSLAPTSGLFSAATFEYADPTLLSQSEPYPIGYTRTQFRLDYHFALAPEVTLYLSGRTGFERNTKPPANPNDKLPAIPPTKQFTLGGAGSLRGFQEQELTFAIQSVRGTLSYVNYRSQLDLPFAGPLRFGPFLDAGQLYLDQYFLTRDLRYGAGLGFHYQSPVGPVNFDWGFKLDPLPGEDTNQFYFSIGVI